MEAQHRETLANMEQNRPSEETPGTSYTLDRQAATHHQAELSSKETHETGQIRKQATTQKATTAQARRTERKRKAISPSKRTSRPTENKTSLFDQKLTEAAIAQIKLTNNN